MNTISIKKRAFSQIFDYCPAFDNMRTSFHGRFELRASVLSEVKKKALIASGIVLLTVLPILLTPFPPSADLPQHIAQVRLFLETLNGPPDPYVILWYGPDNLVYFFLLLFWIVLPVAWVGRAILALIAILWIAAIFVLGTKRDSAIEAMILVTMLVFNQAFYWGFLNFLIGLPVFVLWFLLTTRARENSSWRLQVGLVAVSFLLYASHALWLAAGVGWFFFLNVLRRTPVKHFLLGMTALIPAGIVSLFWFPFLSTARAGAGYDVIPRWSGLFDRLSSCIDAAFGGIWGVTGMAAFLVLYSWIGFSVWQNRKRLAESVDKDLLAAGLFFLTIVILAPDKYMSTIFFNSRWFPVALLFLVLSLPAPTVKRRPVLLSASLAVIVVSSLVIFSAWRKYSREDLSGFREAIDRIPVSSRVLGIDLVKNSDTIRGRPFLQLFAYAQVFKGGTVNFSFAEHYSGLVAYREKRTAPWTPRLEWYGERFRSEDLQWFDFVLANASVAEHKLVLEIKELSPVTFTSPWRLYRVNR